MYTAGNSQLEDSQIAHLTRFVYYREKRYHCIITVHFIRCPNKPTFNFVIFVCPMLCIAEYKIVCRVRCPVSDV